MKIVVLIGVVVVVVMIVIVVFVDDYGDCIGWLESFIVGIVF